VSNYIKDNILGAGDYYPPGVYARLLSWYHDLEVEPDELGPEFIPIATARKNPKLFVVGVLPPAQVITGRLLDRSASVLNLDPNTDLGQPGAGGPAAAWGGGATAEQRIVEIANSMDGVNSIENPDEYSGFLLTDGDKDPNQGTGRNEQQSRDYYNGTGPGQKEPPSSCALFCMGVLRAAGFKNEIADQEYKIGEAVNNLERIAREYGAYVPGTDPRLPVAGDMCFCSAKGMSQHWEVLTTNPVVNGASKTVSGGQRGQAPGSGRESVGFGGADIEFARPAGRWLILKRKSTIVTRWVNWWIDVSALPLPGSEPQPVAYEPEGAEANQADAKQKDKLGLTGLNATEIGVALLKAQAALAAEARAAMDAMKNTPPLRLMVNPRQFDVKGTKIVNDGNWSRNGHIIEHWGDEQDKISASGRVAGFYAVDAVRGNGPGLTRTARNYSASWQNFQSLYMLYRNNGAMYLSDYQGDKDNLSLVGSIYLYYDSILYIGSFDTFTITEEEGAPHTIEYSWEFTVRAAFLLDAIPGGGDPLGKNKYGAPSLFRSPATGGAIAGVYSPRLLPTSDSAIKGNVGIPPAPVPPPAVIDLDEEGDFDDDEGGLTPELAQAFIDLGSDLEDDPFIPDDI
jgi:hypothetical protein